MGMSISRNETYNVRDNVMHFALRFQPSFLDPAHDLCFHVTRRPYNLADTQCMFHGEKVPIVNTSEGVSPEQHSCPLGKT